MALLPGCGGDEKEPAAAAPARAPAPGLAESPGIEFLPRGEQAAGWRLMGDPQVLSAREMASYLDFEARHFAEYDVADLTVGEYDRPDGSGRATVEIFRFPDYVKAFGAYSTWPIAGAPLGLENASVVGRNSAFIWSGPFVVRVISLAGDAASEPIRALATAVATPMPKAPGRPAVFGFFPDTNRIPGSEKFVAGPVFGQPYLARGFVAEFQFGPERVEGMILPAPSKETATEVLNRFKLLFATNGRLLDPIPNLGEDNFVGEDRFLGRATAYRIDRFVVAFHGFGEKQPLIDLAIASNQRILNSILQQLRAAEKEALLQAQRTAGRRAGAPGPSRPAQEDGTAAPQPPVTPPAASPAQTPSGPPTSTTPTLTPPPTSTAPTTTAGSSPTTTTP